MSVNQLVFQCNVTSASNVCIGQEMVLKVGRFLTTFLIVFVFDLTVYDPIWLHCGISSLILATL